MRILIADDDEMVRLVIREMLTPIGHILEEARDGNEALSKFGKAHFDLVLLDHHMPGLNGVEAALQIRKRSPQTRIVILTGSSRPEELKHLTGVQILHKPFEGRELLGTVSPEKPSSEKESARARA